MTCSISVGLSLQIMHCIIFSPYCFSFLLWAQILNKKRNHLNDEKIREVERIILSIISAKGDTISMDEILNVIHRNLI